MLPHTRFFSCATICITIECAYVRNVLAIAKIVLRITAIYTGVDKYSPFLYDATGCSSANRPSPKLRARELASTPWPRAIPEAEDRMPEPFTDLLSALGTGIVSVALAYLVARMRAQKALDACVAAKEACNDEVHRMKDKVGMLQIAIIADKAEILALQNALEDHKNAS